MNLTRPLVALALLGTTLAIPTSAEARRMNPNPVPDRMMTSPVQWVAMQRGMKLPRRAFKGGAEPARNLYICRASYRGGLHPGKVVAGRCNIGWGGREILRDRYEVLVKRSPRSGVLWLKGHSRALPRMSKVAGGYEPGRRLDICRAQYRGGLHPGKVVDGRCNIGWGGREVVLDRYEVLVHRHLRSRYLPGAYAQPPVRVPVAPPTPRRPVVACPM